MTREILEHFVKELDEIDRSRTRIAMAAFESLSASDPELTKLAKEVFETPENAAAWMATKVLALGDEMPLKLLQDGKREMVVDCLYQIEYGMLA